MLADDRDIDGVRGALQARGDITLALVFGSVSQGRAGRESDIDLAVDAGRRLSAAELTEIIASVASCTGRPVDLIDLQAVGEPLLGEILSGGKRLIGSDEAYAKLLTRHLFDAADFLPYRDRILAERRKAWIGE